MDFRRVKGAPPNPCTPSSSTYFLAPGLLSTLTPIVKMVQSPGTVQAWNRRDPMLDLPKGSSLVLSVCAVCAAEVTVGTIGISCSRTNKRKKSFRFLLALGGWYQNEQKSQQRGTICFSRPGVRFCCPFCSRESPWGHSFWPLTFSVW